MPWMPWAWFGPLDALLFFRCAVITKPWDALCDIRNVLIKPTGSGHLKPIWCEPAK